MSIDEEVARENGDANPGGAPTETEVINPGPRFKIPEWAKAEPGAGEIGEYVSHPLNFAKSEGLAQVIRGVVGIVGHSLRYAVLDIVFGMMKFSQERKNKPPVSDIPHVKIYE